MDEERAPKHKPVTPLPWRVAPASEYLNDVAINVDAGTKGYVCHAGFRDDEEAVKNSRYLVHAANAYPKLVEALRGCLRTYTMEAENAKTEDELDAWGTSRDAVAALLRDLGESS